MKTKVLANSKKEYEEYRNSPQWLQNNVAFVPYLRLSEDRTNIIEHLLDELLLTETGYKKKEQKLIDLEVLIANLIIQKRHPISISLNRNDWKLSRYSNISYFITDAVNLLTNKGFIKMNKGYNTEVDSKMTRISATDKLLEHCPRLINQVIYKPVELVELRDDNGKLIEYKNTARTWKIRDILKRINEVNSKADIRYSKDKINTFLIAIFNKKFTLYGRLHTRGFRHYQGLSGEERKEITINGDSVVELDFSGLHPNLLYAMEFSNNRRSYQKDPYTVVNDNPIARPFLKIILLSLLNSKDRIQAEKAANNWLYKNPDEKKLLQSIGIDKVKPIMEAFIEQHKTISHHFCSGKETGLRMMNKDAAIALDIINHFAKQNIPILAIHDSFIVQSKHRDELMNTMQQNYRKHTGKGIKIK